MSNFFKKSFKFLIKITFLTLKIIFYILFYYIVFVFKMAAFAESISGGNSLTQEEQDQKRRRLLNEEYQKWYEPKK
ncbi:hypothetical protein A6A19_00235 [Actinobacillus delphinicola]|uniref:hypothetical protein n=1 Tax=Actinobacillus delphinicola TaxID=51161 RepID=UPI0024412C07|nr:hypothetical protein [Actinobacillus delphinicola]MDG6896473.1 hypothetical protein [Actinobacillus delphinicola]